MKILIRILSLVSIALLSNAQVKIIRPLKGDISNKKILIEASDKKEILVEQFTLFFRTQHTVEDSALGLILKAKLDLEPKLALEITNNAYLYFKESFLKRGFTVNEIETEVFKTTQEVKKAEKRGNEWKMNGTTKILENENIEDKYLATYAAGVNYCPILRPTIIGAFDTKVATTVAFLQVINFADLQSSKTLKSFIIPPSLSLDSKETICGTGGFGFWNEKLKGGSVSFPINSDIKWQNNNWLSANKNLNEPNSQLWTLNTEEFKKAVLELSKAQIDQYIDEYIKAINP